MRIGLDTETFLITRENPIPKNVCVTTSYRSIYGKIVTNIFHHSEAEKLVTELLNDPDLEFVGQNIAFDFASLMVSYPSLTDLIFEAYSAGRITDTTIRQQLFDIAYGRSYKTDGIERAARYTLAMLWEQIFDEKLPQNKLKYNADSWRLRYSELYGEPLNQWPEAAKQYAMLDAETVLVIWEKQEKTIGASGNGILRDDTFQSYAAFCLYLMGTNGMITSQEKVENFTELTYTEYESYLPELLNSGLLYEENKKGVLSYIKKRKPAEDLIIKACKLKNIEPMLTDKGGISTDKKAVYWCGDTLLLKLLKFKEAEHMLSTYIPILQQGYDLPICTRYDLAVTGRTTSSAPGTPLVGSNFQNWPRVSGPRECFVPREGSVFLSGDFAGTELHTLAQVCYNMFGYSTIGEALKTKDVHLVLAAALLEIDYDTAYTRYKAGDKTVKKARQDIKPANFGFPGGMGIDTFIMTQLKDTGKLLSKDIANRFHQIWLQSWPEMKFYFNNNSALLHQNGGVAQIEHYYSKRLQKVSSFSALCNTRFQGLAADGGKLAICEIVRKCYCEKAGSVLCGCLPVNFIHDELVLEVPDDEDYLQYAAPEFEDIMSDSFNKVVPDSPTSVEAVISAYWSKKAEPLIDAKGKRSVWSG
jgi:DNA polymerase-1